MVKQLNEMLKMQAALDKSIMTANGITYDDISEEQYFFAILDEVGEFVHERKKEWCWWKKTQKEVDENKSLEEMVDILHFVLSLCNKIESGCQIDDDFIGFKLKIGDIYHSSNLQILNLMRFLTIVECNFSNLILNKQLSSCFKDKPVDVLVHYVILFESFGYTIDTIYNAYIEKNKVNYERVEQGY